MENSEEKKIQEVVSKEYELGFTIDVEEDRAPEGLNEEIIVFLSKKKGEPDWMTNMRLQAFHIWQKMEEPHWAHLKYDPIDYQSISYYAAPKKKPKSLDEVDPEILRAYEKLGIPLEEQKMLAGVAVDAVLDSVSIATTFKEKLKEMGIIFCSISEAINDYPELVQKYLFSVVPMSDNFFAALNSAVFTDGTFVYVPKGVRCPLELSTYFRI
ncbi:MAG: Fe-S cluster assembly protein SufB, partial [Epsilonproteobacteria bacterium]|nr:Fe-S cluster assembly protein SufB [Campylobacterota bacterium]